MLSCISCFIVFLCMFCLYLWLCKLLCFGVFNAFLVGVLLHRLPLRFFEGLIIAHMILLFIWEFGLHLFWMFE
ncbi:hypothetical protein HanPI659440_Chr01g0026361 [Helianthus annuus]|nr:hypothetical protein HanPI659440_Chr01g0026361 [Helianthus annuus]